MMAKTHFVALLCGALSLSAAGCASSYGPDSPTTAVMNGQDWRDEVVYQIVVDRFFDGDVNNDDGVLQGILGRYQGGDWQGIIDNLDYLQALGVTTLWISPVVKNVDFDAGFDAYHGYWTQDFTSINPHFGSPEKLREMVSRAHEKNFKVILDIVANHMGQLFYYDINDNGQPDTIFIGATSLDHYFATTVSTDALAQLLRYDEFDPDFEVGNVQGFSDEGIAGPAPVRFLYMPEINRVPPPPIPYGPGASDVLSFSPLDFHRNGRVTNYDAQDQLTTGDFPGGLKDLATEQVDVQKGLITAFAKLVHDYDFDGFRIDTLKHVDHHFWQVFSPALRQYTHGQTTLHGVPPLTQPKNNWFMFGEAFDGDDNLLGEFTYNNEIDSVFYFSQKYSLFEDVVKCGNGTTEVETLWNNRLRFNPATAAVHGPYRDCYQGGRCFRTTDGVDANGNPLGGLVPDIAAGQPIYNQSAAMLGPTDTQGDPVPPAKLLVNFLDNHDVGRYMSTVDSCSQDAALVADQKAGVSTLYTDLARQRLHSALGTLLTEDGLPCIYYGTEQEFAGGNDPANREDLFGTLIHNFYNEYENSQREPLWGSGFDQSNATFKWISQLTALRKKYDALRRGDLAVTWSSTRVANEPDANIFSFTRTYNGPKGQKIAVIVANYKDPTLVNGQLSTTDPPRQTSYNGAGMPVPFPPGTVLKDVMADPYDRTNEPSYTVDGTGAIIVNVSPRATKVLMPASDVIN